MKQYRAILKKMKDRGYRTEHLTVAQFNAYAKTDTVTLLLSK